ncbi:MAG: LytR C-terminal domain-containing protein [Candidatus Pacebacteria bacterium]|nr:LytR C-terminal domain-containing protein [Candidatus Paceibacterota bacterium]MDR3583238.1 LytR C-terminal domain-containing protein [Candidatus Paceibacterota bacterium]
MLQKIKNNSFLEDENKKRASIEKFMTTPRAAKKSANEKDIISADKGVLRVRFSKKNIAGVILAVVFISSLGATVYFYYQYKKATSPDASKNEAANYVAKISKFMVLPQGETPTIATVADKDRLSSQAFFANAQNGDKVLFYTKAQKVVLYRPSTNMIINSTSMAASAVGSSSETAPVSPATAGVQNASQPSADTSNSNSSAEAVATPQTAQVAVYNGTNRAGLAKAVSDKISPIEGVKIAETGNAKGIYAKTEVVDLSGSNSTLAQNIATAVSGEVISLPANETKPVNADILVIGGADFKN